MGYAKERRTILAPSERKSKVVTLSSDGTRIPNLGQFAVSSTSTGGSWFVTLDPPSMGSEVYFSCYTIGSTSSHVYLDTTGATFDKAGDDRINFTTDDAVHLMGYTTAIWVVIGTVGSPTFGSTS